MANNFHTFEINFPDKNIIVSIPNFTEVCPKVQMTFSSIGLCSGLVTNRLGDITWTDVDRDYQRHMAWLHHNELAILGIRRIG